MGGQRWHHLRAERHADSKLGFQVTEVSTPCPSHSPPPPAALDDASRWHTEWDARHELARLGREFRKVLRFVEEVPAKRDELVKEGNLSEKGLTEAVRAHYAAKLIPDLRRAAWEVERTVTDIATQRARLCQIEFDRADIAAELLRQELRAHLRSMSQGERVAAHSQNHHFRAAAFEGPATLSGFSEEMRNEIKRRNALEEHPHEAAQLEEAEEAVAVANAAIRMVAGALQASSGFEGNDEAFKIWMTASSADVEREIAAEKSKPDTPPMPKVRSEEELKADIGREIDRIFAKGFSNDLQVCGRKLSTPIGLPACVWPPTRRFA